MDNTEVCINCKHCRKTKKLTNCEWEYFYICTLWLDLGYKDSTLLYIGDKNQCRYDLCECFQAKGDIKNNSTRDYLKETVEKYCDDNWLSTDEALDIVELVHKYGIEEVHKACNNANPKTLNIRNGNLYCQVCNKYIGNISYYDAGNGSIHYCQNCGQKIDWRIDT